MSMARKKKETDVQTEVTTNGTAPEAAAATATVEVMPAEEPVRAESTRPGETKNKPAMSWALNSDRHTRIEVAAWVHRHVSPQGEEYEQVSFTVQRSYRDQSEQWQRGGSWRTHDLPCLVFLLVQKAHAWALERRTTDSSLPF
jgi:hypothetical protein